MLSLNDIINSLETIRNQFTNIGVDTRIQYHVELRQLHNTLRTRSEFEDTLSTQSIIHAIRYSARSQEVADNLIEWVQNGIFFTKHDCSSRDDIDITFHSQPIDVKETLGRFGVRPKTYYIQIWVSIEIND